MVILGRPINIRFTYYSIVILGILKYNIIPGTLSMSMVKLVKLKDDTHAELNSIGLRGESFDDIIKRLIREYKEKNKK
jgi:hypothetical protein